MKLILAKIDKDDRKGAHLNAIIQVAPEQTLLAKASQLDRERKAGNIRSSLHGVPILVKVC